VLRSRKVDLLEQEVWGILLDYNLIRRESTKAAEKHKKASSETSFKFAFSLSRRKWEVVSTTIPIGWKCNLGQCNNKIAKG
jgi:hypothetical protein